MGRIDGKTALVTGASAGIGRAVALRLAEEGARVALSGLNETAGRKVLSEIHDAGGEAIYVLLDVTSETAWREAMAELEETFGRLDILVNNAGITMSGKIEETALEDWRRIMDAVRLFTKCAALECAEDGIRVNSIHPAFIHTPMMEDTAIRLHGDVETGKVEFGKFHPIGHVGEPLDSANGVLYLASDESSFTTGAELVIDGGYTAA